MGIPEGFSEVPRSVPLPKPRVRQPKRDTTLKRVVICTPSLLMGGAEKMAIELAHGLSELGHPVELVDVSRDGLPDLAGVGATIWWGRVFEGQDKPPGSVYVLHSPGGDVPRDAMAMGEGGLIDGLVSVSHEALSLVLAYCPAEIIQNGSTAPDAFTRRKRISPDEPFIIGHLGRYAPEKGFNTILEALSLLPEHVRLECWGEGPIKSALSQRAFDFGVGGRATFHGPTADIDHALARVDCLVFAGDYEGCPMAAIEGALRGIPIVHFGQGVLSEWMGHVDAPTSDRLAVMIAGLASDPKQHKLLSDLCRDRARREHTTAKMAQSYSDLIQSMESTRSAPARAPEPEPAPILTGTTLSIDRYGHAFHNNAMQVRRAFGHEYDFTVMPWTELMTATEPHGCDHFIAFWWDGLREIAGKVRANRFTLCLYDKYSWANQRDKLAEALFICSGVVVANADVQETLEAMFEGEELPPIFICPDGVDLDLFPPQPFPEEFTLGWCGNSNPSKDIAGVDVYDLKGLELIKEAAERCKVPLVVHDLAHDEPIPHHQMAEKFYRRISCYVNMSIEEGGPNTVKEAAACGRPAITTGVGDMGAFMVHESGWIVHRGVGSLCTAIEDIREWDLQEAGRQAQTRAVSWRWSKLVKAWAPALAVAPRDPDLSALVTAFVITTGEPSTAECIERLEAQTRKVNIVLVENVSPMHRAFQAMLDTCETPYYIQVDADMLLDLDAVEKLYKGITGTSPLCAQYTDWLWGREEGRPIMGVKIYRHRITRNYPYEDSISCETPQYEAMAKDGFDIAAPADVPWLREQCAGEHFAAQTEQMAFTRWQRLMIKLRARPQHMGWLAAEGHHEARIQDWLDDPEDKIKRAMALGVLSGLGADLPPPTELDASRPDPTFARLNYWFSGMPPGPRELTLYLTGECNKSCWFCARQQDPNFQRTGELRLDTLVDTLDNSPSIESVCFAGFGEPLMHSNLVDLFAECNARGLNTGLITNGLLLQENLENLKAWKPGYVSMSLESLNGDENKYPIGAFNVMSATGIRVGFSMLITKGGLSRIKKTIDMAKISGADFVHFHNLLPHGDEKAFEYNVIRIGTPEAEELERIKASGIGDGLVEAWPVPIGDPEDCPRTCQSPFVSIGVDANGAVTPCRRILPPDIDKHGGIYWPMLWHSKSFETLRAQMMGDLPLPDTCAKCFGGWSS